MWHCQGNILKLRFIKKQNNMQSPPLLFRLSLLFFYLFRWFCFFEPRQFAGIQKNKTLLPLSSSGILFFKGKFSFSLSKKDLLNRYFFLVIFFFPLLLCAQIKKGFSFLDKKKYPEACAAFQKDLGKDDPATLIQANYGLSLAYAAPDFAGVNPDTAWHFVAQAQKLYKKADRKLKDKLSKNKRGYSQLAAHQRKVEEFALSAAIKSRSTARIEEALNRYKGATAKTKTLAAKTKESILKEKAEEAALRSNRDLQQILEFLKKYPNPVSADSIDLKLAPLLKETGSVCAFEEGLSSEFNLCAFPKTAAVLLDLYLAQADGASMETFAKKYGNCLGDVLEKELEITKKAGNADLNFEKNPEFTAALLRKAAPRPLAFKAAQALLKSSFEEKNWQAALDSMNAWKLFFGDKSPEFSQLLRALEAPLEGLTSTSLGSSINTEESNEIVPVVSADGRTMYFCRGEPSLLATNEDIYFSQRSSSGWTDARPLEGFADAGHNEAPLSLTADGTGMFFFYDGDVSYMEKTTEGWEMSNASPVNFSTPDWEGMVTISPDKKVLLFEAVRGNNVGLCHGTSGVENPDLFVCFWQEGSSWGTPLNLGPALNTPFRDRSPFLHPDGKTLYFSSDGHGSLGGMDVFKTTRLDSTWLHWSLPVNLGKEINTTGEDWGYQVSLDGQSAFFSSDGDIRQVLLPKGSRPDSVSTFVLKLVDLAQQPFLEGKVVVRNLDTKKIIGEFTPDPQTNEVFITVPADQPVLVEVVAEGAPPISLPLNQDGREDKTATVQVPILAKMKANEEVTVELKNLFFETDSFTVDRRSEIELQNWATFIREQGLKVEIAGHTDDAGSEEYNRALSQKRADAAKEKLIELGCEPEDLSSTGYGEKMPVCPVEKRTVRFRFAMSRMISSITC